MRKQHIRLLKYTCLESRIVIYMFKNGTLENIPKWLRNRNCKILQLGGGGGEFSSTSTPNMAQNYGRRFRAFQTARMSVCAWSAAASSFHRVKKAPLPLSPDVSESVRGSCKAALSEVGPRDPGGGGSIAVSSRSGRAKRGENETRILPRAKQAGRRPRFSQGPRRERVFGRRSNSRPAYRVCLPACPVVAAGRRRGHDGSGGVRG